MVRSRGSKRMGREFFGTTGGANGEYGATDADRAAAMRISAE
jgi:hypothetical protein